jgi:hypothetical protein
MHSLHDPTVSPRTVLGRLKPDFPSLSPPIAGGHWSPSPNMRADARDAGGAHDSFRTQGAPPPLVAKSR